VSAHLQRSIKRALREVAGAQQPGSGQYNGDYRKSSENNDNRLAARGLFHIFLPIFLDNVHFLDMMLANWLTIGYNSFTAKILALSC